MLFVQSEVLFQTNMILSTFFYTMPAEKKNLDNQATMLMFRYFILFFPFISNRCGWEFYSALVMSGGGVSSLKSLSFLPFYF